MLRLGSHGIFRNIKSVPNTYVLVRNDSEVSSAWFGLDIGLRVSLG